MRSHRIFQAFRAVPLLRAGLAGLAVCAAFPGTGWAQSGKFPALSTEESVPVPPGETRTAARFPVAETTDSADPAASVAEPPNAKKNLFPTDGAPEPSAFKSSGVLDREAIGQLLAELELTATRFENRHDFLYRATVNEQELELYFSVFLEADGTLLRVRAWLDPLPTTVISEQPLLGLLARNVQLQRGLHYGYSQETRRFLLEAVIRNDQVDSVVLKNSLEEVSREVASSWALWSTSEWTTGAKRVASHPELDSRAGDLHGDQFEMPIRR